MGTSVHPPPPGPLPPLPHNEPPLPHNEPPLPHNHRRTGRPSHRLGLAPGVLQQGFAPRSTPSPSTHRSSAHAGRRALHQSTPSWHTGYSDIIRDYEPSEDENGAAGDQSRSLPNSPAETIDSSHLSSVINQFPKFPTDTSDSLKADQRAAAEEPPHSLIRGSPPGRPPNSMAPVSRFSSSPEPINRGCRTVFEDPNWVRIVFSTVLFSGAVVCLIMVTINHRDASILGVADTYIAWMGICYGIATVFAFLARREDLETKKNTRFMFYASLVGVIPAGLVASLMITSSWVDNLKIPSDLFFNMCPTTSQTAICTNASSSSREWIAVTLVLVAFFNFVLVWLTLRLRSRLRWVLCCCYNTSTPPRNNAALGTRRRKARRRLRVVVESPTDEDESDAEQALLLKAKQPWDQREAKY